MSAGEGSQLRVFVASRFLDDVKAELAEAFEATFDERGEPAARMAELGARDEVVLVSLDAPLPASSIAALPDSVRAIATYSVGTDHIDLDAARARGLAVFNTPGVLADSVAENAIFLMLGAARRATESIDLVRSGSWTGWTPIQLVGVQLSGRTLGILGMGDIGERIATRAQALGMEVLYCNRRRVEGDAARGFGFRETPKALVSEADVLVVAAPSTAETRGIVNGSLLESARPGLIVVNIARGDLVEDADLVEALRDGRVWAAGLDVFAGEPNLDPRYRDLPNVFMLPHVGSSTIEARLGMGRILIEGLAAWQSGGEAPNRVC